MGNSSSNSKKLYQQITNNSTQVSQQTCKVEALGTISGNTIALDGSTVNGSVGIFQKASAQASCVMATQLDTNVQNILASLTKQSSTSISSPIQATFNDSSNSVDIKQEITNNLTQIISATCEATSNEFITGNVIMAKNTNVKGDVKILQESDAKANCAMTATAKVTSFNQEQEQSDQKAIMEDQITNIIALLVIGFLGWCMVEISLFSDEEERAAGKRTVTINNYNPNPYAQQYPAPYQSQYQQYPQYQQTTYQYQPQYQYPTTYTQYPQYQQYPAATTYYQPPGPA